ncbi:MAG: hypothetical protein HYR75_02375, partial [Gemmatimonadetes bacterium]|nr:hypothetical protein [Gemmatimonadota bacterium]
RVIREDPERRGLLYAGTETGVYISFDGGARWQPFSQNLPVVPVTGLEVRHGNLYASTEGRAFWALDDVSPVRQLSDEIAKRDAYLFAPHEALLVPGESGPMPGAGRNPAPGAAVYFSLAKAPDSTTAVTLEFLDARGVALRKYAKGTGAAAAGGRGGRGGGAGAALAPKAGLNVFHWDLRSEPPTALPGINIWGGGTSGFQVPPGRYTARLTVGTTVLTQPFDVRPDPRSTATAEEVAARDSLSRTIVARMSEIHDALLRIRDLKAQVGQFVERAKDVPTAKAIEEKGKAITGTASELDPKLSTKAANGQDVINYRNGINAQYGFLLGNVEGNDALTQPMRERFIDLEKQWGALRAQIERLEVTDIAEFNKLLAAAGLQGVILPKPKVAM